MQRDFAYPEQDGLFFSPTSVRQKDKLVQLFVVNKMGQDSNLSLPFLTEYVLEEDVRIKAYLVFLPSITRCLQHLMISVMNTNNLRLTHELPLSLNIQGLIKFAAFGTCKVK